jgi:hypothetical protein
MCRLTLLYADRHYNDASFQKKKKEWKVYIKKTQKKMSQKESEVKGSHRDLDRERDIGLDVYALNETPDFSAKGMKEHRQVSSRNQREC